MMGYGVIGNTPDFDSGIVGSNPAIPAKIKEALMEDKKISPLKAIKEKCMDCCCWQYSEVKKCTATKCPLYPFRMGKNPYIKRSMSEDRKAELRDRLQAAREKRKEAISNE